MHMGLFAQGPCGLFRTRSVAGRQSVGMMNEDSEPNRL